MRIGIDCRMLGPAQGGLGRYVEQLVNHLVTVDSHNQYVLFLRKANFDLVNTNTPRVTKVLAEVAWYGWREQLVLPALIKAQNLDLMHWPHWNIPVWYRGKFVVTIHDLIMYHYPRAEATTLGPIKYWLKDRAAQFVLKRAVEKAAHIFTTSEFTKRDLVQTLGLAAESITVTYQATTPLPTPTPMVTMEQPYILYVGSAYPHKNLPNLLQAWLEVNAKTAGKYRLVLIGSSSYFYQQLEQDIGRAQIPNVIRLDYQTDATLAAWYQQAKAYVFPSVYEGFGLPPLEAMSFGVPVVAAAASCLPEVLGDAALYFDPTAPDDIARALLTVLTNQSVASAITQAGKVHAAKYSWQTLARNTLAVYEKK